MRLHTPPNRSERLFPLPVRITQPECRLADHRKTGTLDPLISISPTRRTVVPGCLLFAAVLPVLPMSDAFPHFRIS